ncbi:GTP 3',8-cyclase MoaA [Ekhidna sp. To15]|uniref:GTP 3',8-cyclase MoaA n=1 Tax=Ekhidna sp. To15 TaxID=3395267 RepID=UPI003F523B63
MESKIIDKFGRPHSYLRISLTDRCNLRCFYCMPEEGIELMEKPSIMTLEEIIEISKIFVDLGVDTIRLTGGEPLVRKNFEFLARELTKLGVTLKLTTNGILLDKYFDLFKEIGLKKINISLDTLDKAKNAFITKRDYYDRIMANIREGIARGFQLKLNVVLIKDVNDQEINDFIALTKDQNIDVKFIEFMPFKGNKWDWSKGVSEEEILAEAASKFGEIKTLKNPKHSTSNNFQVAGHQGSFGIISTITNPFCSDCNRLRLTADGKMKNCLFANSETDILGPHRKGEAIDQLILDAIKQKKYSRDGMDLKMDADQYENNRSMISIGG